jgi:hypothetical protein
MRRYRQRSPPRPQQCGHRFTCLWPQRARGTSRPLLACVLRSAHIDGVETGRRGREGGVLCNGCSDGSLVAPSGVRSQVSCRALARAVSTGGPRQPWSALTAPGRKRNDRFRDGNLAKLPFARHGFKRVFSVPSRSFRSGRNVPQAAVLRIPHSRWSTSGVAGLRSQQAGVRATDQNVYFGVVLLIVSKRKQAWQGARATVESPLSLAPLPREGTNLGRCQPPFPLRS